MVKNIKIENGPIVVKLAPAWTNSLEPYLVNQPKNRAQRQSSLPSKPGSYTGFLEKLKDAGFALSFKLGADSYWRVVPVTTRETSLAGIRLERKYVNTVHLPFPVKVSPSFTIKTGKSYDVRLEELLVNLYTQYGAQRPIKEVLQELAANDLAETVRSDRSLSGRLHPILEKAGFRLFQVIHLPGGKVSLDIRFQSAPDQFSHVTFIQFPRKAPRSASEINFYHPNYRASKHLVHSTQLAYLLTPEVRQLTTTLKPSQILHPSIHDAIRARLLKPGGKYDKSRRSTHPPART